MEFLNQLEKQNGVYFIERITPLFQDLYLKVREAENRILKDHEVAQLPVLAKKKPHASEWKKRQDTANRFANYLYLSNTPFQSALEIGCGNGWFSNWLAKSIRQVIGQDINLPELEQAARVFQKPNLHFICAEDLFKLIKIYKPQLVVFNASLQYFNPKKEVVPMLLRALDKGAEIHVLDSPVYPNEIEVAKAKVRSDDYYAKWNCAHLSDYYFHYSLNDLKSGEFLYKASRLGKLLNQNASPFPWIRFRA